MCNDVGEASRCCLPYSVMGGIFTVSQSVWTFCSTNMVETAYLVLVDTTRTDVVQWCHKQPCSIFCVDGPKSKYQKVGKKKIIENGMSLLEPWANLLVFLWNVIFGFWLVLFHWSIDHSILEMLTHHKPLSFPPFFLFCFVLGLGPFPSPFDWHL